MYHRQRFPLWLVWGNGLGQSFFLAVTSSSGQAEWSASPGSHSFEVHSCEQFRRMVRYRRLVQDSHFHRKWFEQSFLRADSFSPGCTVISAGRMAQLGEWSRFNNQGQSFPRVDSFSPGCTMISAGRMAQLGDWSRFRNQGQLFFYA
jgi:hypothetical protein